MSVSVSHEPSSLKLTKLKFVGLRSTKRKLPGGHELATETVEIVGRAHLKQRDPSVQVDIGTRRRMS
jgi:hypothetical protein